MRKYTRQQNILLFLLLLTGFLSACHLKETVKEEKKSVPTEAFQLPEVTVEGTPANTARIACLKGENWHPLTRFDASGRAVLALCYRGLFFLDSSEHMVLDLAESAAWNEAGTSLTIALRQDVSYEDGKPLTAVDVAHSLKYYRYAKLKTFRSDLYESELNLEITQVEGDEGAVKPAEEQPTSTADTNDEEEKDSSLKLPAQPFVGVDRDGLEALLAIQKIELLDHRLLRIVLNGQYPELLYHLDFPIVPAESLEKDKASFPATGSFRIQEEKDGDLILKSRDQSSKIQEIKVFCYPDEDAMLKALSDDEVDLLYLTGEHFSAYQRRRDLRSLPRAGRDYHLLIPGRQGKKVLNDPEMQQAFQAMWQRHPEYGERVLSGDAALYPLRQNSALWPYLLRHNLKAGSTMQSFIDLEEPLKLECLVPKDEKILARVKYLKILLYEQNILLDLRVLKEEDYLAALSYGDYDLAYVVLKLDYPFNPLAFWQALGTLRDDYRLLIAENTNETQVLAEFYREPLSPALRPEPSQEELEAAAKAMANLSNLRLYYGLGFEPTGILLGPRVGERFTLLPRDPYYHLKEVTIWSNFSP